MVKPPKSMQPEGVDLDTINKKPSSIRGFGGDSFRNYMARKIDLQRKQFGVMLPPAPERPNRKRGRVRFSAEVEDREKSAAAKVASLSLLQRLVLKHGKKGSHSDNCNLETENEKCNWKDPMHRSMSASKPQSILRKRREVTDVRRDLFFRGVVVIVNGYTNPDQETLMRMLHKHGGDLEKYETTRLTHIIAQNLSTAKANIYKKMRRPLPVCRPDWIVDSVKAGELLPVGSYLIKEVLQQESSVRSFFQKAQSTTSALENVETRKDCKFMKIGKDQSGSSLRKRTEDHQEESYASFQEGIGNTDTGFQNGLSSKPEGPNGTCASHPTDTLEAQSKHPLLIDDKSTDHPVEANASRSHVTQQLKTDAKYINGKIRTTATDPDFLSSFFANSRLSFIGSYRQRTRHSPTKQPLKRRKLDDNRFVFHVDMDCFFASVVLRNFPQYRTKPVAISHHGKTTLDDNGPEHVDPKSTSECATCNYEARKYGITKGMFLGRAKALCPDLIVLKYDFKGYEEVSEQVADILFQIAERYQGTVEEVSCDEAYLELYLQRSDGDEESLPSDLGKELADSIRAQIFQATQCTATVGVAKNKLLAKLATDKVKPNSSFVTTDHTELLRPLKLRDLHGIGWRMGRKLTEQGLVSVCDIWELGEGAEAELCRILGPGLGKKILGFCNGIDDRPVQPAVRKTIGAECNYGMRFGDGPYGVNHTMEGLAKEVARRMEGEEVFGIRITLKVKRRKENAPAPPKFLGHGSCHNLSRSVETVDGAPTRDWQNIAKLGMQLFEELGVPPHEVRGMGLVVSNLSKNGRLKSSVGNTTNRLTSWLKKPQPEGTEEATEERTEIAAEIREESVLLVDFDEEEAAISPCLNSTALSGRTDSRQSPDDDDDIFVPPRSQIHLSQVDALPSPVKLKIFAKLNFDGEDPEEPNNPGPIALENEIEGDRLRQVSVKRMLKLAAVRSGQEDLSASLGHAVSLTQLDCLPLELQLQIANGDNERLGSSYEVDEISRNKRKAISIHLENDSKESNHQLHRADEDDNEEQSDCESLEEHGSFYSENTVPLREWMDANSEPTSDNINTVIEFLCLCVSERRLGDATKLLRSISNRSGRWSEPKVLNELVDAVSATTRVVYGKALNPAFLEPGHSTR